MIGFIESLLLLYFLYVVCYTLVFSVAAVLRRRKPWPQTLRFHRILVLIPAYREDAVILETARKAIEQDYPADRFEVVIVADSIQEHILEALKTIPVHVLQVAFGRPTKVKALNHAFTHGPEGADIAVILDADNHMAQGFLRRINDAYSAGCQVIQGQRSPKNHNTHFAILDGLSEYLNTHVYRAGSAALGLSAALMGSAMAFNYTLVRDTLAGMKSIGGFDRELEVLLLTQGHKARYLPEAIVYDEKTQQASTFAHQRRRWIASQYIYLKRFFGLGMRALACGNFALFNSAVLRNIQLPRVLNLGLLLLIAILSLVLSPFLLFSPALWWILLGLLFCSLVLAVPLSFYNRDFWKSLVALPHAFLIMLLLLFRLKGANRRFIHTPHGIDQDATN